MYLAVAAAPDAGLVQQDKQVPTMYVLYLWRQLQARQKVAGGICGHNADLSEGTQQASQLSCLDCCHAA